MKHTVYSALAITLPLVMCLASGRATAQEEETSQAGASATLEEIVVVGSRRRDRSAADSPVPVDVIGGDQFQAHGSSDMDALLSSMVPSYNVAQELISDAATLIRPATLRSLPPDATLVLDRAAVIALLAAGIAGVCVGYICVRI